MRLPRGTARASSGVLILVLMEYGLRVLKMAVLEERLESVLILVLMEYGLRGQICEDLCVSPLRPKNPQNPKILRENMYL